MGGDHGHGHHHKTVIPDYKIYKVEDSPTLMKLRDRLAEKGLKDPWIRNEVWRFQGEKVTSVGKNLYQMMSRGFGIGFGLFVLTMAVDKLFFSKKSSHGEEHGAEHH